MLSRRGVPHSSGALVDERTEQMGGAYVMGVDPDPIMAFSARVGGPLASTQAEAATSQLVYSSFCWMCCNASGTMFTY